ncbi:MAG: ABC transporter substrate-binding protein [Dehalococcoidia bacterium]|nr:ABC transporter substrate-binding protein [Dehalococcoidia bacterium]
MKRGFMMRNIHRWAVACLLVVMLAACAAPQAGEDSRRDGGETAQQEALAVLQDRDAVQCDPGKEHWRTQGLPKRGGTATIGGGATNLHMDITQPAIGPANFPQVYDYLVKPRACYWEDLGMVPSLAKSWQVSQDGRTWTLQLRDDVKWHNKPPLNGRPFTAADVIWTIEQQQAGGQVRYIWDGIRAEAQGAHAVVLHLPESRADFLFQLGLMFNPILPREVKEQHSDFKTVAVGTGPFMVKEFKSGVGTQLEPNPDYYDKGLDGKPLPYLDQVRVLIFGDYIAEVAAIRAGQLDHNSATGIRLQELEALKQGGRNYRYFTTIHASTYGLLMNVTKKPFDDVRVRKAMALAINVDEWLEGSFKGSAVRSGFMPVTLKEYAWPQDRVRDRLKPDPERAKALLAEAGYGPGQLEFNIVGSSIWSDEGEVVQRQLSAVGVNVKLATPAGIRSSTQLLPLRPERDFQAMVGYITNSLPLPGFWMNDALRTYLRYDDPKLAQLTVAQNREMDPAKRKQIIDELQEHLYEVMPYVPTFSLTSWRVQSCQLKNMRPSSQSHNHEGLQQAWIDPAGC